MRRLMGALAAVAGFSASAITVLGWLNVTPEMVGQATYDAMRGPAPLIVMFVGGALFGWGVTKLWSDHRARMESEARSAEVERLSDVERELAASQGRVSELEGKLDEARRVEREQERRYQLEQFSDAQLEAMETVADEMDTAGCHRAFVNDDMMLQLSALKVVGRVTSDGTRSSWVLTPSWRSVVVSRRDEIDARLSARRERTRHERELREAAVSESIAAEEEIAEPRTRGVHGSTGLPPMGVIEYTRRS